MVTASNIESFKYDAETDSILTIIIHYCYSDKDVFLRELISNSSDSCDKIRFKSIQEPELMADDDTLRIRVVIDKEAKQLHIYDSGIGMTKAELIKNLGTIAKSGTKKFLEGMKKSDREKVNQIGQFGIGFYSGFLVADKIACISKSPLDDMCYKWESDGSAEFTIQPMPDYDLKRGAHIILDIKEGCEDFLKESTVENTIKKYSSYVPYPIYLQVDKTKEVDDDEEDQPADDATKEKSDEEAKDDEGKVEEIKDDAEKPTKKKKTIHYQEDKQLNAEEKIWDKDPSSVTEEEAEKAYKQLTKGWSKPFLWKSANVEGATNFNIIIFIHQNPKTEVFESKSGPGLVHAKLFNKGVFLRDCDKKYPLFHESALQSMVMVALDTKQAPHGISRDDYTSPNFLKLVGKYAKNLVYKTLTNLHKDHPEKFVDFKKKYSSALKLLVHEDGLSGHKIVELITFPNTLKEEEINLQQYVADKAEKQSKILFAIGANKKEIMEDPTVKELVELKQNVLIFTSQLDEIMVNKLREFQGMKFQDIRKEGFVLYDDEDSKKKFEEAKEDFKPFLAKVKSFLGSVVSDVKLSNNIKDAFGITVPDYALSPQMEIMHENQPLSSNNMSFFNSSQKTLVFNPYHQFVKELRTLVMSEKAEASECVNLVANLALYKSKYPMKNPKVFGDQVFRMLQMAISGSGSVPELGEATTGAAGQEGESKKVPADLSADANLNEVD